MKNKCIIITLFLFTFSLLSQKDQINFKFDLNLIQEWKKSSRYPQNPPYLYEFKKNNTSLKYLAVRHTPDLESKTYKMIKEQIVTFKPEIIVIEGIESGTKRKPDDIFKEARSCLPKKTSKDQNYRCGESRYAIYLAGKNKILFRGGEPSRKEEINQLRNTQFIDRDIVYFYISRSLYGRNRANKLNEKNLNKIFQEQLNRFKLTKVTKLNFHDFLKWYQEKLERPFSIQTIKNDDYAPYKDGHFLNKISFTIDTVREKNILLTIEKAVNEYKKVLVIYGASHLYKHQKVLDQAFK